jgi:hypothetical protein
MAEIDAVYFLTDRDCFWGHEELRYSLRSLERHVAGVGRVFVVGCRAKWRWREVEHVPAADPYPIPDANIIHKMQLACGLTKISNPFLFVNDDHFFTRDCRAGDWPYFYQGELSAAGKGPKYGRRAEYTRRELQRRGLPVLNFDVHAPILINKAAFLAALAGWEWAKNPGVLMKSVYGNTLWGNLILEDIEPFEDLKLRARTSGTAGEWVERLRLRPCWSSGPHVNRLVREILSELYPGPSRYEVQT